MKRKKRIPKPVIPTFEDRTEADFVDILHDNIVFSRLDNMVDVSEPLNPKSLKRRKNVRNPFDSNKTRYGNSGVERLDVVNDSEKW